MIETACQTPCSPQVTNPAFNAVAEALRGAEPGLPLTASTAFRFATGLGQTDARPPIARASRSLSGE